MHLISFDIPLPADYGGVMDVFYKIKALHETGVPITLHCFQYRDRQPQPELEKYCEKVYYYRRDLTPLSLLSRKPFIVKSRESYTLLKNLKADNTPILFEGLHTCACIDSRQLRGRLKIVRMHNVEWEYYRNLKLLENRWWKRLYFKTESEKLKQYEKYVLKYADFILPISPDDQQYFEQTYDISEDKCLYIPPFHPNDKVESRTGTGEYVLFHGKLSIADNAQGAVYLIQKVFSKLNIPFIIAGKDPSVALQNLAALYENIQVIANPEENEMTDLIQNAQINVLVSFQRSGMKLKLLNALYRGRFCLVNAHMVQNTGLESLCYVKNASKDIRATIESLMNVQFSNNQINERRQILDKGFSNKLNAEKLAALLKNKL